MSIVENGVMGFSKEEFIIAKKLCKPECPFACVCGGPDSKISGAEIHPNKVEDPSDEYIKENALCIKQLK